MDGGEVLREVGGGSVRRMDVEDEEPDRLPEDEGRGHEGGHQGMTRSFSSLFQLKQMDYGNYQVDGHKVQGDLHQHDSSRCAGDDIRGVGISFIHIGVEVPCNFKGNCRRGQLTCEVDSAEEPASQGVGP